MSTPQKGKGRKRPRKFHHGQAEGRRARRPIAQLAAAEERGRTVEDELHAVAARYHEDVEVWSGLPSSAPFVPRLEATL